MKAWYELTGIALRFVIAAIFMCGIVQAVIAPVKQPTPDCPKFYDGEGNEIPTNVVNLLVKSEFVWMTAPEIDSIQRHFYLRTRHICPFIHCPMIDQITFHGCGACEEGSECYALDAIHWDYPTLSYDDCEEIYLGVPKKDTLINKQNNNEEFNHYWKRQGVPNRTPNHWRKGKYPFLYY